MVMLLEIAFPVDVEATTDDQVALAAIADAICKRYNEANPGRVMWPAGHGFAMRFSESDGPMLSGIAGVRIDSSIPNGEEPQFDDSIYQVSCAERERYDEEGRD